MQTKLIELQANLDMTNELLRNECKKLHEEVSVLVNDLIAKECGAKVVRSWVRLKFLEEVEVHFELGFWDAKENKYDFGSDASFCFNSTNNYLETNYGTIGRYSKHDKYQVMRVNMTAHVFRHIDDIEEALRNIVAKVNNGVYRKLEEDVWNLERDIERIEQQQRHDAVAAIEAGLKVGQEIGYSKDIAPCYMLFDSKYKAWTIKSISERKIKLISNRGDVRMLDKGQVLNLIYDNTLSVKE